MAQNAPHTTAKIYRFPARPASPARRLLRAPLAGEAVPTFPRPEFGSGWYHEAAIRAAEKSSEP